MPATIPNNHLFPPGPCEIAVRTALAAPSLLTARDAEEKTPSVEPRAIPTTGFEFLGTTREGGRAQEILYTGNIPGDYSGSDGMPADIRISGKGIVVVCQIQNFNPFTMNRLKSRYYGLASGFESIGLVDANDIGGFLIQEGRMISVCIRSLNAFPPGGAATAKYPNNEAGIYIPFCFPSGELGWDYAAREQVYSLTFLGVTYMNMSFPGTVGPPSDPQGLGVPYNGGTLYAINSTLISSVWAAVTNPTV